LVTEVQNA